MRAGQTVLRAVSLGIALSVFGGASAAFAGELTGSNYNAAFSGTGLVFTSCVRTGGGQTVILSGTGLSDCTAITQMGGGWTGSVPLTVNGDGTSMSFVVPNDTSFYGWSAISGCTLDNSNVFLYQSGSYPRLDGTITVTADSIDLTTDESAGSVAYSSSPASSASDWGTEPTCAIYNTGDLSTPLTGTLAEGVYTSHCADGDPVADADVAYTDGVVTVTAAPTGGGSGGGESNNSSAHELANTGVDVSAIEALATLSILAVVTGTWLSRRRLRH